MAIDPNSSVPSAGKFAIRKLVKAPNGVTITVYTDAQTGKKIPKAAIPSYTILSSFSDQLKQIQPTVPPEQYKANEDKAAEQAAKESNVDKLMEGHGDGGSQDGLGLPQYSARNPDSKSSSARTPANNYGYREAPRGLGLASFVPGMVGTAAKVAKTAFNVNNQAATGTARETVGLDDRPLRDTLASIIGFKDSQRVANVRIGDENYAVGLGAEDKQGRTTLTPSEARIRGMLSDSGIQELSKEDAVIAREQQRYESVGRNDPDFNGDKSVDWGSSSSFSSNDFPDAPVNNGSSSTSNSSDAPVVASNDPEYSGDSSSMYSGGFSGNNISPAAQNAVNNNEGGLF